LYSDPFRRATSSAEHDISVHCSQLNVIVTLTGLNNLGYFQPSNCRRPLDLIMRARRARMRSVDDHPRSLRVTSHDQIVRMESQPKMRTGGRFPVLPQSTYSSSASHVDSQHGAPPPSYQASIRQKPSLDLPQRLERKLARYNASENVVKRWMFEILSVATSAVCMGENERHPNDTLRKAYFLIRCYYRDTCSFERPISRKMACGSHNHNCPVQDRVRGAYTAHLRSYRATQMVLVPWERVKRCLRLRNLR
jgi:hypothetical protein